MSSLKNPYTTPKQAKTKYYPFTKKRLDLNLDRTADSNSPYTRSGFANVNKAINSADKATLPNVVEGIVLLAPDEPIKYTIKSNNQNKENCSRESYEGYCIWVRTPYDQSTLADPIDILNNLIESDKFLTPDLKVQLQLQYLDRVHAHGMYAPINKEQRKPIIGEHVKIHFYNSNKDSGEIVKGFYEIISDDNATFNLPSAEQQKATEEIVFGQEEALIIEVSDKELPKPSQIPEQQISCGENGKFEVVLGAPIPTEIQPLLNMIASREGSYNSMNQGTRKIDGKDRIVGSTHNASTILGKNLTDMTFREVLEFQNKPGGSKDKLFAAGKYQLIPVTMKYIVEQMKIPLETRFSPENQESIGLGLIKYKRPIAWNYLTGKHNNEDAALLALAQEWASLPDPRTGKSYYGGANRSGHTVEKVREYIRAARQKIISSCSSK